MRRSKEITITTDNMNNRDRGKKYLITEMPCEQAEEWAMRMFLAMGQGGVEIPDEVAMLGMAGLGKIVIENFVRIPWHEAKPLLAEMMECVQSVQPAATRRLYPDDIEEISTRMLLRKEVMSLHVDFFGSGDSQTSDSKSPTTQGST